MAEPPQLPFTGHATLALLHAFAAVLVPPLIPLHHQVEDPPHDPATLDTEVVPFAQAYWVALLHHPSTLLFALQAFAAVLVPPFGLLHPHVHGQLPMTLVGVPVAQVAVGRVYELNTLLHTPFIQAELALEQVVAVVLVPPSVLLHPHVAFCPQLLATLDTEVPTEQAKSVVVSHTAGVPHDWLFTPTVAQSPAHVGDPPPTASVQVRVWFHPEQVLHAVTDAGVPQD